MPPIPLDFSGGVNLLKDRRFIADNEWVRLKNLVPTKAGMLATRPASAEISNLNGNGPPRGAMIAPFDGLYEFIYVLSYPAEGSYVVAQNLAGSLAVNGQLHPDDVLSRAPALVAFNKKIYVLPGYPCPVQGLIYQANPDVAAGSEFVAFAFLGTNNEDIRPAAAGLYRDRMIYGNLGPGFEDCILFADPYLPTTIGNDALAANGRFIRVGAAAGDRVVAVVEITQSEAGNPTQSALLVLLEYSAFIYTGEPNLSSDSIPVGGDMFGDLIRNKISFDCGCSSPDTVASSPYGLFWASHDDVWFFARGSLPLRVGSKIRPALANTPAALRWKWHGAYDDGFYKLAIFAEGQGTGDFDACEEMWWLDLRSGPPQNHEEARWFGPQVYTLGNQLGVAECKGTFAFAKDVRPGKSTKLYGIQWDQQTEDGGFVSFDTQSERDYTLPGTTTDVVIRNEINIDALSKEFDLGEPTLNKVYEGAEITLWNSLTARLYLDAHLDGGREIDSATEDVLQTGFVMDVDQLDTAGLPVTREHQAAMIYPSAAVRRRGKTVQLRIYTQGEYLVTDDNDTIVFSRSTVVYTGTIVHGTYATASLLAVAVAAAMTAALVAAGVVDPLVGSVTGGFIRLTMAGLGGLRFVTGSTTTTPAELRKSRKIGALMGFDTSVDAAEVTPIQAGARVYSTRNAMWEISALAMRAKLIRRRPT